MRVTDVTYTRYIHLNNFDAAMHGLEEAFSFMHEGAHEYVSLKNEVCAHLRVYLKWSCVGGAHEYVSLKNEVCG